MPSTSQTIAMTTPAAPGTSATAAIALNRYKAGALVILASLIGATGGALDVYIQETWDVDANGVALSSARWFDVCHFTQLAAASPAVAYRVAVQSESTIQTVGVGTTAAPAPALAAAKVCGGPWGPLVRLVAVAGTSTSAGAAISVAFEQRSDA